ncbi:uncharacterized protein LOC128514436 [Clarias gariepinus]|uniref:uncharacterized protein LOC128514436 n=1 Tax=Clarias gariepinus TaxID=13013 RepID=UPI00234CC955|nr:uncharacterized protein LOC128514436 [Clarias gariepinus]
MVRSSAPGSSSKPRLQDSGQQTAGCKPTPEDVRGKKLSKLSLSKALGCQQMVSAIIHKWKNLGTVVKLSRSDNPTGITPGAQLQPNQELKKDPGTTSVELQASLATVKVSDKYSMHPEAMANPSDHVPTKEVAESLASPSPDMYKKNMVPLDDEEASSGAPSFSVDGHLESTNLVPPSLASAKPDYPREPGRKRLYHAVMARPLRNITFSIHTKPQRKERTRAGRKHDLLKRTLLQSHMRKVLSLDKEKLQAMFPTKSQKLNLLLSMALNGECVT